jgi:hypothetical protein
MFQDTTTRRIVIGVGVIASMLLLRAPAFAQPPVNVKSGKFETATEKKALKALRMKGGYKGDAEAKALADKLNRAARVTDSVQLKGDEGNAMTHVSKADPSGHFRVDKTTGDFSFHKGLKNYTNDKATPGLVTEDRAPDAAKKYLTDLGLMPEKQDELVVKHVGGLRQQDVGEDGKQGPLLDKLVTVHFGRQIDGVDVGGPGSKIVVDLGANGELVAIQKRWIEVTEEAKGAADFKGQADVVADVKKKLGQDGAKAKKIDVSAPDFGWWDDGKGNIEPAYFYDAELTYDSTDAEGKPQELKEKHLGAVPALKNSKADFTQLEKAGKQPGRAPAAPAQDKPSRKD